MAAGHRATVSASSANICSFFFNICSYCALRWWKFFTLHISMPHHASNTSSNVAWLHPPRVSLMPSQGFELFEPFLYSTPEPRPRHSLCYTTNLQVGSMSNPGQHPEIPYLLWTRQCTHKIYNCNTIDQSFVPSQLRAGRTAGCTPVLC